MVVDYPLGGTNYGSSRYIKAFPVNAVSAAVEHLDPHPFFDCPTKGLPTSLCWSKLVQGPTIYDHCVWPLKMPPMKLYGIYKLRHIFWCCRVADVIPEPVQWKLCVPNYCGLPSIVCHLTNDPDWQASLEEQSSNSGIRHTTGGGTGLLHQVTATVAFPCCIRG